jgi:hypothetical protein
LLHEIQLDGEQFAAPAQEGRHNPNVAAAGAIDQLVHFVHGTGVVSA